jgi:hypothetical protein
MANTFGTSDPTVTSINGHDRAYTTANRPTNMTVGEVGFNTTTGQLEVANGVTMNVVGNPPDNVVAGGAGLAGGMTGSAGGVGVLTTAGGAGGAIVDTAGAGGAKTGTGAASGGAGGSNTQVGGAGGNTASSGTDAGGAGGISGLTGGVGGNASAGTGNGGAGGSIPLNPGAGGTSAGGTAGVQGSIQLNGPISSPVTAAQTLASAGTVVLPTTGRNKLLTNAGAITGVILPIGRFDGDDVVLINTAAGSITMAAAGTSRVADGVSCVIPALGKMSFVWSATQSLWYH